MVTNPADIALGTLVPLVYIAIDNSEAVPDQLIPQLDTLIVGQQLAAATVPEKTVQRIQNVSQAKNLFGKSSQIALAIEAYYDNNPGQTPIYAFAFDDEVGTDATGTLTVTGPATEDGILVFYVSGKKFEVTVSNTDAATAIGAAIEAAITADTDLPVTAANVTGTVTLTAKNSGTVGNQIQLSGSLYSGEAVVPAGVTLAAVAMASGATDPDIDDMFTAIGDTQYGIIAHPYNNTAALGKLDVQLRARFGPTQQNDGYAITALSDSVGNLTTAGNAENSEFNVLVGIVGNPADDYAVGAAYAAQIALEGSLDPARPFQTLVLEGILSPNETSRATIVEQDALLSAGIATITMNSAGESTIQRAVTTYKTDENSEPDVSYQDLNTLLTVSALRFSLRNRTNDKFPRHKLADDGTRAAAGQPLLTPKVLKAEIVALFNEWESLALVEDASAFKKSLVVVRSATDQNRIEVLLKPDLVNQGRVFANVIRFLL